VVKGSEGKHVRLYYMFTFPRHDFFIPPLEPHAENMVSASLFWISWSPMEAGTEPSRQRWTERPKRCPQQIWAVHKSVHNDNF